MQDLTLNPAEERQQVQEGKQKQKQVQEED